MSKSRIFLSYTLRDKELADTVLKNLHKVGIVSTRPDTRAKEGANWSKMTTEAIRKADVLVVLASSPEAVMSSWIGYEVGAADALGKATYLLKPSKWSVHDFPADLQGARLIDLDPKAPDRAAQILASSLAAVA